MYPCFYFQLADTLTTPVAHARDPIAVNLSVFRGIPRVCMYTYVHQSRKNCRCVCVCVCVIMAAIAVV